MPKKGERTAEYVTVTCPCGREFEVTKKRFADGRGRRCSKECQNRYATRPSGLKYNVKVQNRGWFGPGNPPQPHPGHVPWNKGIRTGVVPANAFKQNPFLTYSALHALVRKERGLASEQDCAHADGTCKGPMHWANMSGKYESLDDFAPLCQSHHIRHDKEAGFWGTTGERWQGRPRLRKFF